MLRTALPLITLLVAVSAKLQVSIERFNILPGCFLDASKIEIVDYKGIGVLDGTLELLRDLGNRLMVNAELSTFQEGVLDGLTVRMVMDLCNSTVEGNEKAKKLIGPLFKPLGKKCPFMQGSYRYNKVALDSAAFELDEENRYEILFELASLEGGLCVIQIRAQCVDA